MKPTKRAYFRALGSNFVIFQRRKPIFIDFGQKELNKNSSIPFCKGPCDQSPITMANGQSALVLEQLSLEQENQLVDWV
jgi:hypothetical protein